MFKYKLIDKNRHAVLLKYCMKILIFSLFTTILAACSSTKYLADEQYLLDKVEIKSDTKDLDVSALGQYIRQKANSKWFMMFKIPLGTYSLSGNDTTKWINRTLRKIGEEPVIYDTAQARISCDDLLSAMQNMGYMNASVSLKEKIKGKKLTAVYTLHPGKPFIIKSIDYDIEDENIAELLGNEEINKYELKAGSLFTVDKLDEERSRITKILNERGFYKFNKDFITYIADSVKGSDNVALTMHIMKYKVSNDAEETLHPRYKIRSVNYLIDDGSKTNIRQRVIENNTIIKEGKYYNITDIQRTYNNFSRLGAVAYTRIKFNEIPDSSLLDCNITIKTNKPNTVSIQPEGTNTAGDFGAALTLEYTNRNLFKGSELFSIQGRMAFEDITGLDGYQNKNYKEYSIVAKLAFPRFVAPFISRSFRRKIDASSELSVSWDMQNRPEFHRRVFSTAWRYKWNETNHNTSYRLDLIDIDYVYMPWISSTFKHDYMDSVSNRNAILRYNYEDLFIIKMGFGFIYQNRYQMLKFNFETAGNLLNGASKILGLKKNEHGRYIILNTAYAQYVKGDLEYTRFITFDKRNSLVLHGALGIAYPYGNSSILPFEKRYFSGGANSVRGWKVRGLGPGSFKGADGRIDFINQTGDVKLDLNIEYRASLFWKFDGALFVDAGNIWTIRNYAEQPGGQFRFDKFYKQIAMSYGLGLRLNLNYFIVRLDAGMRAIDPVYESGRNRYPLLHPSLSRDMSLHFAVGLPF